MNEFIDINGLRLLISNVTVGMEPGGGNGEKGDNDDDDVDGLCCVAGMMKKIYNVKPKPEGKLFIVLMLGWSFCMFCVAFQLC